MSDRYPAHVPLALAEVLGQPPHQLSTWWCALRDVGVDVPKKYEGEVAAALHFLIPFAIRHGDRWRETAATELLYVKNGAPFRSETVAVAHEGGIARDVIADTLLAAVHALRSYQYGNSAPDLAASTADMGEAALRAMGFGTGPGIASTVTDIQRQHGLSVEIEGGRLIIAIGIDALMTAIEGGPHAPNDLDYRIESRDGFADDIRSALLDEEDDGTTLVHVMLDAATERALEGGSLNVEFEEDRDAAPDDTEAKGLLS